MVPRAPPQFPEPEALSLLPFGPSFPAQVSGLLFLPTVVPVAVPDLTSKVPRLKQVHCQWKIWAGEERRTAEKQAKIISIKNYLKEMLYLLNQSRFTEDISPNILNLEETR